VYWTRDRPVSKADLRVGQLDIGPDC